MRPRSVSATMMLIIGSIACAAVPAVGQETASTVTEITEPEAQEAKQTAAAAELPNRWLLLCCGLPGDDGHRERLTGAVEKIVAAAEPVFGVSPQRLRVLAGDEEMQNALADQAPGVGVCTKESVARMMEGLCAEIGDEDSCWIMLLGHAHLYQASSKFNVLDADFDQTDFALWARPLACREQVFWVTMPVSGFWIKPLSGKSRVVISATEADLEFTGTEMPYALADLLSGDGESQSLEDVDQDGSLSLLDLYLAANLEIHGRFPAMERLQTEHAQLEDNGDGRGSEVQLAYLPEETDESEDAEENSDDEKDETAAEDAAGQPAESAAANPELPEPIGNRNLDGYRSRFIVIRAPGP